MLLAARLKRTATEVGGANQCTKVITRTIKQAHDELGHMSEDMTRKVAKELGWTIVRGTMKICESCAKGKANFCILLFRLDQKTPL